MSDTEAKNSTPLRIRVLTLFPEMFEGPLNASILGRAARDGLVKITCHQLRDFTHDRHRTVDDTPYGGGPGMVMKAEPLAEAIEHLKDAALNEKGEPPRVILLSPQGRLFSDAAARDFAAESSLLLVCGHYEGVDQRVIDEFVDDEVSIGDYVLTGGELPALVVIDAVARLVPGVLGHADSAERDSFAPGWGGLLQGPVYTRPVEFRGRRVPDVLLSGDHARVDAWRWEQAILRTQQRRPDLEESTASDATAAKTSRAPQAPRRSSKGARRLGRDPTE